MNRSGDSVRLITKFFNIKPEQMLIAHDEIELNFGQISFKIGGGLAGHNGLRSVAAATGTRDFLRFRLGISRPDHSDISSYVLSKFSIEEQEKLPDFLNKASEIFEQCLSEDTASAEGKYRKLTVL